MMTMIKVCHSYGVGQSDLVKMSTTFLFIPDYLVLTNKVQFNKEALTKCFLVQGRSRDGSRDTSETGSSHGVGGGVGGEVGGRVGGGLGDVGVGVGCGRGVGGDGVGGSWG